MFIGEFSQTKWREPYLVGRCLGAAENVRFIGCYGGSKPPPYGFVRTSNTPINQNLKNKLTFSDVRVSFRSVEFSGLVAPENCRE